MTQQPLFTHNHQMSHRMEIAMHLAHEIARRESKRPAVSAWARVVKDDLAEKLKGGK